jgi:hypothetical protein
MPVTVLPASGRVRASRALRVLQIGKFDAHALVWC